MRESLESERDGNGAVFPCLGRVVLPIGRDPVVDELDHGTKTGVNELDHGAKMGLEARRRAWRREDDELDHGAKTGLEALGVFQHEDSPQARVLCKEDRGQYALCLLLPRQRHDGGLIAHPGRLPARPRAHCEVGEPADGEAP